MSLWQGRHTGSYEAHDGGFDRAALNRLFGHAVPLKKCDASCAVDRILVHVGAPLFDSPYSVMRLRGEYDLLVVLSTRSGEMKGRFVQTSVYSNFGKKNRDKDRIVDVVDFLGERRDDAKPILVVCSGGLTARLVSKHAPTATTFDMTKAVEYFYGTTANSVFQKKFPGENFDKENTEHWRKLAFAYPFADSIVTKHPPIAWSKVRAGVW